MERILVSACLLGLRCRYSGERKADERVSGLLKRQDVVLIPVCPEQLGGLPTPREPAERRDGGVWNRAGQEVSSFSRERGRPLSWQSCTGAVGRS